MNCECPPAEFNFRLRNGGGSIRRGARARNLARGTAQVRSEVARRAPAGVLLHHMTHKVLTKPPLVRTKPPATVAVAVVRGDVSGPLRPRSEPARRCASRHVQPPPPELRAKTETTRGRSRPTTAATVPPWSRSLTHPFCLSPYAPPSCSSPPPAFRYLQPLGAGCTTLRCLQRARFSLVLVLSLSR
jgi:hypothetical protein